MYTTKGQDYEMVCKYLVWMPEVRAIQVMRQQNEVYCTGTALKPDEWKELIGHDGDQLPDGSTLKITHIPMIMRIIMKTEESV